MTASGAGALLEAEGLRATRGGVVLYEGLRFSLRTGGALGVSGPSGCGKSTLLRQLADLDPGDGVVRLRGVPSSEIAAPNWRRQVLYVPQQVPAMPGTPAELRTAAAEFSGRDAKADSDAQVIERCLALTRAWDVPDPTWHKDWRDQSVGERQRVALALGMALLRDGVLLLDEPTAALDEETVAAVEASLHDWLQAGDVGLLWVSHSEEQLERISSQRFRFPSRAASGAAGGASSRTTP